MGRLSHLRPRLTLEKGDVEDGGNVKVTAPFTPGTTVRFGSTRPDGSIVRSNGDLGATRRNRRLRHLVYDYVVRDGVVADYLVDALDQDGNTLAPTSFTIARRSCR